MRPQPPQTIDNEILADWQEKGSNGRMNERGEMGLMGKIFIGENIGEI